MSIQILLFDPESVLQGLLRASPALETEVAMDLAPSLRAACSTAPGGRYDLVLIELGMEKGATVAPAASEPAAFLAFEPAAAAGTAPAATARWLGRGQLVAFLATCVSGAASRAAAQSAAAPGAVKASLSARELQILDLLAEGNTSKQIAALLRVSPHTVDSHRASIMKKLHIHTLAGLIRYALEQDPGDDPRPTGPRA
jgi:DNA-binding CsgD family transcriptional regulator